MKKILWIVKLLEGAVATDYTGKIEINFFQGGVTNVNRFENLKPPPPEPIRIEENKTVIRGGFIHY